MNCQQCLKPVTFCTCVGGAYFPSPSERPIETKKWTQEEYDKRIEQLRAAMAPAQDALRFLSKHHPTGRPSTRMPLGIISKGLIHSELATVTASPDVVFKPTYLVVSHETSKAFNLVQMAVGNAMTHAGGGDIPLEPFSMEYLASLEGEELKAIMSVQKWDMPAVHVGMRINIYVKNISDQAREFRGILWGEASLIW